jgi:hypothetical protein
MHALFIEQSIQQDKLELKYIGIVMGVATFSL